MAEPEIDDETLRIVCDYCGHDPQVAQETEVEETVLPLESRASWRTWTLAEFQQLILDAIESVPLESRASAEVEYYGGEDGSLTITYRRMETIDEVTAKVARALKYALEKQAEERKTFERLKQKFG